MPKKPEKTLKQLAAENEELRARLDEAEETLRAIRAGEVDALVVSGVGGEQVFTLTGADRPFRILIEEMNEGALTVSQEGIILYANRRFAEMLKTPLEKVIGSTFHTWIAPAGQKIFQSLLQKGADEKRRRELLLTAGDGAQVPVYLSVSSLPGNEMPDSFCLVATDLTDQKRSEAMAASEKSVMELLDNSNQARLALLSVIEDQKQAEESLKTYAERLKDLHRIDLVILQAIDSPEKTTQEATLHLHDLLHCQRVSVGIFDFEKKEARVFAATGDVDSVVQTGLVFPEELYGDLDILRQNKVEIIEDRLKMETVPAIIKTIQAEGVRSSINAPIVSPQGLIGALSIGWDTPRTITSEEQEITSEVASQIAIVIEQARLLQETKRHTEELEETVRLRTAQLEATNKELEAFSYSVSHDLQAPLRHISGYVDLLNKRSREALPEKAGHYMNEITDSVKQMGTLIDDLLQFSRTGRQELRHADMDMNAAVQEALEKLKVDTKNRIISWTVAGLPRVFGDYSLFKQVWMNLLGNAIKFTRHKDEATIEVGFTREPGQWVFFVRDNGVGFDMQYAHKLFGVFQRLHSPAQFEGTGIGLANVQRIVNKHGGRVWAEAQPDQGATFYFTIPYDTHR